MWPVTQVNTDLKPPKIVTTEINSLGEKQPTLYTLINKSISYKFSYSAFNKCKVYNIVVESFPWFWLFKKVYVSLIFLWHRYTSSEIRGKKLTLDMTTLKKFPNQRRMPNTYVHDSQLNILHYWTVLSSLFIIITHKKLS